MLPQLPVFSLNTLILNVVQVLFLIGFGLYVIFAFIATRQISIMRRTVITPLSPFIQLLGYAHLALAIAAFLFAYTYLK